MVETSYPRAWYPLCLTRELRRRRVRRVRAFGVDWAAFRGDDGAPAALRARCPHMAADLTLGHVHGDSLRCALHGFAFGGDGRSASGCRSAWALTLRECAGVVFAWLGAGAPGDLPLPDGDIVWSRPTSADFRADWRMIAVNGYDIQHLPIVHRRELVAAPTHGERDGGYAISYRARVVGTDWRDRLMRLIGVREVAIEVMCWGGSHLLFRHRHVGCTTVFALLPVADGRSRAFIVTARQRTRTPWRDRLALAALHRGIVAFIREDRPTLLGAAWDPSGFMAPCDAPAIGWAEWYARLPLQAIA